MPHVAHRVSFAAKVSVAYALCASLWILASGAALRFFIHDAGTLADLDIYKDIGFVIGTALVLFLVLKYRRDSGARNSALLSAPPHGRRLLIAFAVGAAVALAIGHFSFRHFSLQIKTRAQQSLAAIADLKARQIESWLAERRSDAQSMLEAAHIASDITRVTRDQTGAFSEQLNLAQRLERLRNAMQADGLTLLDRDGRIIAESGWKHTPESYYAETAGLALKTRKVQFVDLHTEPDGKEQRLAMEFFAPLLDPGGGGEAVAVVVTHIDPHRHLFPLIESWPVPSRTAESRLVRRDGDNVVYLSAPRDRNYAPLGLAFPLANSTTPAARGLLHGNGVYEGDDYRNVAVLAATRAVPGTPWMLVTKIDRREVYEGVTQAALLILILTLSAIVVGALLITLLWRQQQAFHNLQLRDAQERGEALIRHFSQLANSINDSVFLFDDRARIVDANDPALAAYGYSRAELLKLTAADLRAPEETAELTDALRAIDTEESLAYETAHRRRNGSVFPVEISARKFEAGGRAFIQAIVRDLSERKAAERRIHDLNRLYATLSAANRAIVHATARNEMFREICGIAVAQGEFAGASIGMLDPMTQRIEPAAISESLRDYFLARPSPSADAGAPEGRGPSGIALRVGRAYYCNDFLADPVAAPWHEQAARAGIRASAAVPLIVAGQPVGTLNLYAREKNFFSAPICALVEEIGFDISYALDNFEHEAQRSSAERTLAESENKFRGLVEQSIAGIFILAGSTLSYVNPRAAEIFGYTQDELVGRSVLDFISPATQPALAGHIESLLSSRVGSVHCEFAAIQRHRNVIDVGAHMIPATYQGNPAILGMLQDIGEHKQAEEQARRHVLQLEKAMLGTIDAVSAMIELRDPYTSGHERRVGKIAAAIGAEMGLPEHDLQGLRVTGYVHDIGKISCPAEILSKPGRLSALEFAIIRTHPQQGYDILRSVDFPWPVAHTILQHHERFDGSGYPHGIKGESIILPARIIAVADVIEAMATHRPYRPGLGVDAALREIEAQSGKRYDPTVAAACLKLFREKNYQLPA